MKHSKNVVMAILVLFVLSCASCNLFQRKAVTESYKISGELLESTRISMRKLCDNGTFTPEKCAELKASYELAASNFIKAGEMLKAANQANIAVDDILASIKSDIRRVE